ncbi:MAG: hypothetical protein IJG37_08475 [Synergistaceae bacterium]|nr:hypothetical protein [Synergistaceae bacterium]
MADSVWRECLSVRGVCGERCIVRARRNVHRDNRRVHRMIADAVGNECLSVRGVCGERCIVRVSRNVHRDNRRVHR